MTARYPHAKSERNLEICRLRSDGRTCVEIAKQFGITRIRVLQIVGKAGIKPIETCRPSAPANQLMIETARRMLAEDIVAGRAEIAAGLAKRKARCASSPS